MYRITTPTGETFLTEKANFIRVHPSGHAYLLCKTEREIQMAEGVSYHGTPYLFKDGNIVSEVDVGSDILETQTTEALTLELAADHEARLCNLELGV